MNQHEINQALEAVEDTLRQVVDSDVAVLREASQHIISSGGKRVRPRLLLLAYAACGGRDFHRTVDLAAAIEMVHTATLVHDDINDHSDYRRGKVAVHARWGRTFALLTGDFLFTKVYELMAPYGNPYNELMSAACVKLVEGETLQAHAAKTGEIDREIYKKIIARKTASLFEVAAEMGARLAGADDATAAALRRYGYNLGIAFQLTDDILDVVGSAELLGKPVGLDVVQSRGVLMAENGHTVVRDHTTPAVLSETDPAKRLMSRLLESGALEIAQLQAQERAEQARAELIALPASPMREALDNLVTLVIEREN